MKELKDIRILWAVGAAMLISCSIGLLFVGSVMMLPIVFIGTALGHSIDFSVKWLLYSSPLWAPIGMGMGIAVVAKPVRWLRSKKVSDKPESVETSG
ncbi:hypothetical protein [Sphingopyxis sp. MC1]|uniref:hypothetical protein n=1 Tax=Sphingopyxis sp. MC1 TaxID=1174684 RepID=UPI0002D16F65|nr:hypothetical protein [Sphingopyxis sp. MC1]ENY80684.1 hypothetical protein EBMC1_12751 [Sphingopyxis sp. MC1]